MRADVSQQAEHKREKYQQQKTHTVLIWCKEIFAEVTATVDFPLKHRDSEFPSLVRG